jgi:hypothetical protein
MSQIYDDPQRLTGQIFAGTLEVKSWQGRDRYEVACQHCGTSSIYGIAQLKAASACPNRACSVTRLNRPETDKTEQRTTPERPKPLGSLKDFIESEREQQRLASKLTAEKEAARARAEQETIDKLQSEAQDALRKITANERKALETLPDEQIYVSPALQTASMSKADAEEHNLENARAFVVSTPGYFQSEANSQALQAYFAINRIGIYDASMLAKAYERLRSVGLIEDAPAYQPAAYYRIDDDEEDDIATVQAQPSRYDKVINGFDVATGEPRLYSEHELDRLSASEYKIAVRPRLRIRDVLRHV